MGACASAEGCMRRLGDGKARWSVDCSNGKEPSPYGLIFLHTTWLLQGSDKGLPAWHGTGYIL